MKNPLPCDAQVETWWFHLIAASVIGSNTVTIVLEADSEAMTKKFYWFESLGMFFFCVWVITLITCTIFQIFSNIPIVGDL